MNRHDIEFKVGDMVTYAPYYDDNMVARIIKVDVAVNKDERIIYNLQVLRESRGFGKRTLIDDGNGLICESSGFCIKESKYYHNNNNIRNIEFVGDEEQLPPTKDVINENII